MTEGWIKIFSATELYQVQIAEDVLQQNGIISHIANKPDSVLPFIGSADLYTSEEDAATARQILADNNLLGDGSEEDE
ncbi:MAG: putative signal transducing protein [Saprospiraceae bacterium]